MSKLVFNRDGGKTDEFGHLIALMRFMQGEVIEGLQVAANGTPNMSVNVPYGVAAIPVGSGATGYRYFVGLNATENVAIPTANGSNPRNDLIVLWVDKSVTPSQSFTNNSNNMLKISVVSGAPATTPADPSVAAIQAAIGAANPYIILARVVTGAGVTQINNGNITDLRSLTSVSRLLADMVATAHIQNLAVTTAKLADLAVTTVKIGDTQVTRGKIDNDSYAVMRIKATTNTTLNTGAVTPNMVTTDLSVGSGLTRSGSTIVIGAGISRVKVSAVLIADSMSNDTYMFSRLRHTRGGVSVEFTSQLQRNVSGFTSNSHPPYVIDVQSGDIIDIRVDIGAGSAVLPSDRPQWLQVEVVK